MTGVHAIKGDVRQQLTGFAEAYAAFMSDPFVRSIFRLVMAERPCFQSLALGFFEKGQAVFGATLIDILTRHIEASALKPCAKPSWAAGQLMGMIEHPVFFVPMITGDEVVVQRTNAQIAADAVDTFLARHRA